MNKKEKPLYIHGKRWYRSLKASKEFPNSQYLLRDYDINDLLRHLVVCLIPNKLPGMKFEYRTKKGKMIHLFAYFDSYTEFYQYMCKFDRKDRNFFEVIFGELPQKPHFDIDIALKELENDDLDEVGELLYQAVIQGCIEVCRDHGVELDLERDILLYNSHGEDKRSYHVVINNKCHDGNVEAKAFYTAVMSKVNLITAGKYCQFVDDAVYNPKQQFRIMGCQKYGSNRPKVFHETFYYRGIQYKHKYIENFDSEETYKLAIMYESLVSFTSGCTYLPSLVPPKPVYNNVMPDIADDVVTKCVTMMKRAIADCPFSAYKVSGGLILLKRNAPSDCPLCNKIHDNQDPYLYVINSKVYWDCRRSKEGTPKLFLGYLLAEDLDINITVVKENDDSDSEVSDGEGVFMFGDYDMGQPLIQPKSDNVLVQQPIQLPSVQLPSVQQRNTTNVIEKVTKTSQFRTEKQQQKENNDDEIVKFITKIGIK